MPLPSKDETVQSILSAMAEIQDKELNEDQNRLLRKVDGILWSEIIDFSFTHLQRPDGTATCGTEIPDFLEAEILEVVDCLDCIKIYDTEMKKEERDTPECAPVQEEGADGPCWNHGYGASGCTLYPR